MVNRVVATKLTDEEHTKLLDACNREGCTPSDFIKRAILESVGSDTKDVVPNRTLTVRKEIGLEPKYVGIIKTEKAVQENKPISLKEMLRRYNQISKTQ